MIKVFFSTVLIYLFSAAISTDFMNPAFAKELKVEENVNTSILMRKYFEQLKKLKKYSVSDAKFSDPKNFLEISENLKEFAHAAKEAGHDQNLSHENFKFSRQVLENHILETERVFRFGNKSFARWMLNSTISVCMSCHAQMPGSRRSFFDFVNPESYFSELEQAEFLFATRDFEKASEMYDKIIIRKKNKSLDDQFELEKSLERQVAYYSRIKRSPSAAIKKFKSYLKVKGLPERSLRDIKNWILQFEKWEQQVAFDPKKSTEKEMLMFAKSNLDKDSPKASSQSNGPDLVTHLYVSGSLYEYLYTHPKTESTAEILYWLAISDRLTNDSFFYSLADMYLRECITKYFSQPIAKSCYSEYEKEMVMSYSGSRGTFLPDEVAEDLRNLKKLVYKKQK